MITDIDMHIRDERLLKWLEGRGLEPIPYSVIAGVMGCHVLTVGAMLKRLERGGYIHVVRGSRRYGYRYIVSWGLQCPKN